MRMMIMMMPRQFPDLCWLSDTFRRTDGGMRRRDGDIRSGVRRLTM